MKYASFLILAWSFGACTASTPSPEDFEDQERDIPVMFVDDTSVVAAKADQAQIDQVPFDVSAASVEDYVAYIQDEHEFPGIAAAIVGPDGVWWEGTFGHADIENERKVDRDTLFLLASISKLFVGTAVMKLVEQGLIDLDRPIDEYLGYRVVHPSAPEIPITVRMLLTHVSGLIDGTDTLGLALEFDGDSEITLEEFTSGYLIEGGEFYSSNNFGSPPEERRAYSNANFATLGRIVERVSGRSFPEFVDTEIFSPLKITDAAWRLSDLDVSQVAIPYFGGPTDHDGWGFYPAIGLRMSVAELGRYLQMFMNRGSFEGTQVLAPESIERSWTPQFTEIWTHQGLAWRKTSISGEEYWFHSGSSIGAATATGIRTDGSFGIILLSNSSATMRETLGLGTDEADAFRTLLRKLADRGEELALQR